MDYFSFTPLKYMLTPELLAKTQKSIFLKLQDHIHSYQIAEKPELKGYRKSFTQKRFNSFQKIELRTLIKESKTKRLVFFGDFHPFTQSQKGFLRFVKMRAEEPTKIAIALECLYAHDQPKINAFLAGKITLQELEEEIQFGKRWPFPWQGYADILHFSKKRKIPVLAINCRVKNPEKSLHERDKFSAKVIHEFLEKSKIHSVFCLIGELHLGRNHLPKYFLNKQIAIVHQNLDDLYFKSLKKYGQAPEVLRLANNEYCAFNAVPWVKSQSFLDWIEGGFEDQSEADAYEQIYEFSEVLRNLLGITLTPSEKVRLLCFPDSPDVTSKTDEILFRHAKKYLRTSFLPNCKTVSIPILSANAKTEAAALYLRGTNAKSKLSYIDQLNTNFVLYHFLIGFLGSKLLNPNRKCNEVDDLKKLIARKNNSRLQHKKSEIASAALNELSPYLGTPKAKDASKLQAVDRIESLRLVGYILGNRLYLSLNLGEESDKKIMRNLFLTKINDDRVMDSQLRIIKKVIHKSKGSPKNKTNTL